MKSLKDLSIIILSFNTKDFLRECLQSIKDSELKGISYEVIVVDNASTDGSIKEIKDWEKSFETFISIFNKENLGFAAGNNVGIKRSSGRYVLFLNPDTVLTKNSLREVFRFMESHIDAAVASPRLELPNGLLDEASHRGFPTPWNAFCYFSGLNKLFPKSKIFAGYTKGWLLETKGPHEVDSTVGAFFFVRREAGEEVGWWDEDYFWYGDEIDFCYRLKERGWKIFFLPQVKVLHYKGVASGIKGHSKKISTASKETKLRAARASIEAMRIFYKKHYRDKYPQVVTWLVFIGMWVLESFRFFKHLIF